MDELTTTFAKAKFGEELTKKALNPAIIEQMRALASTPELPENRRKLRDLIEKSIREEQRKMQEAQDLIGYGKKRLTDPNRMGGLGTLSLDAFRAMIPGLSISASADDGIKKQAAEDADSKLPGRIFDVSHALAAGTGAGAGYAAQKGLFGGEFGRDVAERVLGGRQPLQEAIMKLVPAEHAATKHLKELVATGADDIGLAAQRHTPVINKLTRALSPSTWRRWIAGLPASPTAQQAQESLIAGLVRKGTAREVAEEMVRKVLPEKMIEATGTARNALSAEQLKRIPGGWKGALIGAALLTAPFMLYRFLKTRSLRRRGGTAAEEAAEKAERLLSGAKELRKERQELFPATE